MTKAIQLLILLSFSCSVYAQDNQTLSERLWQQVDTCYSSFEDEDKDGKIDYDELIDDSSNGYLKVVGGGAPCGCTCDNSVGAYKDNNSNYVFIKRSAWVCTWGISISSSKSLKKIFPFDFEAEGFFSKSLDDNAKHATFYIDVEIPRSGTDTKVSIELIPFGLNIEHKGKIELGHYGEEGGSNHKLLSQISRIANKIKNEDILKLLLDKEFGKISDLDMKLIHKVIGERSSIFKNKEALVHSLQELKDKYDLYMKIEHQWLILGWDREKAAFYIKEKGERPKVITFKEFLKDKRYWSPLC